MKLIAFLLVVSLNIVFIQTRMAPVGIGTMPTYIEESESTVEQIEESSNEKGINGKQYEDKNYKLGKIVTDETKKPCAVVVLSNIQHPSIQALLRKYRYNADGVLIPNSVKYYIKVPQGMEDVLVPLSDKAFSPLGGFVRYYKEVPPIPQMW